MIAYGPFRHLPRCTDTSAVGGQADIARTLSIWRFWTLSDISRPPFAALISA
jgi:hypothetical protein